MAVVGIVERNGRAVARVMEKTELTFPGLSKFYQQHVDAKSSIVVTDEYSGYQNFRTMTRHAAVNHRKAYAVGETHTNTIEGFWALVKRSWYGQHHYYSRKWADHYISETAYKYNNRKSPDVFGKLLRHMAGVGA